MASRSGRTVGWGLFPVPGEKRTWAKAKERARELLDAAEQMDKRAADNLQSPQSGPDGVEVQTRHAEPDELAEFTESKSEREAALAELRAETKRGADARAALEQQLAGFADHTAQLQREIDRTRAEAERLAQQQLDDANRRAQEIVAAAKDRSEELRAESGRELAAATRRRDTVERQLSQVSQMLATLSNPVVGTSLRYFNDIGEVEAQTGSVSEPIGADFHTVSAAWRRLPVFVEGNQVSAFFDQTHGLWVPVGSEQAGPEQQVTGQAGDKPASGEDSWYTTKRGMSHPLAFQIKAGGGIRNRDKVMPRGATAQLVAAAHGDPDALRELAQQTGSSPEVVAAAVRHLEALGMISESFSSADVQRVKDALQRIVAVDMIITTSPAAEE